MNAFHAEGPASIPTETDPAPVTHTGRERKTDTRKDTSLERTFEVFTAPKKDSRTWRSEAITWDEFTSWAEEPADRKECGNYIFGTLRGGRRTKSTVVSRSAVQLDADKATEATWEALRALGARGLVHTTFSSRPDALRLRAVLPLDRPVTRAEYVHIVAVLMDRLGRDAFDPGSVQPERFMFKPSAAPEYRDAYRYEVMDGPELSADELLAVEPTVPVHQHAESGPVPAQERTETPEATAYASGAVPRVLADLRELADLAPGERNAKGQGWEEQSGLAHGAAALVEFANTAPVSYPIEQAEADFMQTAPLGEEGRWARKWEWAMKQAANNVRTVTDGAADFTPLGDWGDAGLRSHQRMAARLATAVKGRCLYVHGAGWHYWDGKRWAPDHGNARVHGHLEALLRESWAESIRDKDLQSDVKSAMTAAGSRGVIELAATRRELRAEEVDADPYLLNCQNGTLDLHTLTLRPADPADLITKVTAAAFDPAAASDTWDRLLADSLPDATVRGFLQRYTGLALVGRVIEHLLVVAHGAGRNGKGMFAYTMQKALGDYGITATNDLLTVGRHGHKSAGELSAHMQLRGARWAVMSELNEADQLAEATMKALTGGDTITAKAMGKDWVNFAPSHSLFLLTNNLPRVPEDAQAAWARIRVVPYEVSFIGHEDTTLEERLELELDAALSWAVAGLREYQRRGLDAPPAVMRATSGYRADNDAVARFLSECCEFDPEAWTSRATVRQVYEYWARSNHEQALSARALTARLRREDRITGKKNSVEGWQGLAIAGEASL